MDSYWLEITNIDKRYTGISRICKVLLIFYSRFLSNNKITTKDDQKQSYDNQIRQAQDQIQLVKIDKKMQKVFQDLKQIFITILVLAHYNFKLKL